MSEDFTAGPCEDTCDTCGAQAAWVVGKYGAFIACSKYPKCKWTIRKTRGKRAIAASDKETVADASKTDDEGKQEKI